MVNLLNTRRNNLKTKLKTPYDDNREMKYSLILISIFFISCESTNFGQNLFNAPKVNNPKEQIYKDQELPSKASELQTQLNLKPGDKIDEKLIEHVNKTLSSKQECNEVEMQSTPSSDDILENQAEVRAYIENTEPEYGKLSRDEKIKHNFKKLGGSTEAIDQALCFFNKNKKTKFRESSNGKLYGDASIKNQKYMVVQDFTLPSYQKRFFLISLEDDPENGKKAGDIDTMYSSHGMGTRKGPSHHWEDPMAKHFSNEPKSSLTPRGFMTTGNRGVSSKGWKWNMQLNGLQKGLNDKNRDRLIYFHPGISSDASFRLTKPGKTSSLEDNPKLFEIGSDGKINKYATQNMTWGCTAVAEEYAEDVYAKTKGGALYYNFTPHEKALGSQYCGGDDLLTSK